MGWLHNPRQRAALVALVARVRFLFHHPLIGWNEAQIISSRDASSHARSLAEFYYSGWGGHVRTPRPYRRGWSRTTVGAH